MKTTLQFLTILLFCAFVNAQETVVNLSMQPSYTDEIYYKLSTETQTSFTRESWDIAFLRASSFDFGIRVNSGIGIQVFDVSNDPSDWSTVDVANEATWTELHNNETSWSGGAFDNGSADGAYAYGWGNYNFANHHIEGDVVFVLKYADGTFRKFFCEDYYSGYTFRHSTWDGTNWSADVTATVANTSNPNNKYNYYSLQNNAEVVAEPAISDWDFVFTKYTIDYFGDGTVYYPVTGALHSDEVTMAQNDEPSGMPANPTLTYSDEINTIGYDWKTLNASWTYDTNSNQAYYVKYADDTIYRLYFTAFEGSSTGNISFAFEDVTNALSIEDVSSSVSFGIYPNPSIDRRINLIYDVNKLSTFNNSISIFSVTGKKVYDANLNSNSGFFNKSIDLSSLASGVYVVQFTSGNSNTTKKLILK